MPNVNSVKYCYNNIDRRIFERVSYIFLIAFSRCSEIKFIMHAKNLWWEQNTNLTEICVKRRCKSSPWKGALKGNGQAC